MTDNMVEVTVEVLNILAIATKEVKQSVKSRLILHLTTLETDRGSEKFLKKVAVRTDLDNGLRKLDKLTHEGVQTASGEVGEKVRFVGDQVKVIDEIVQQVIDGAQVRLAKTLAPSLTFAIKSVWMQG